jgi:hypothetical protein
MSSEISTVLATLDLQDVGGVCEHRVREQVQCTVSVHAFVDETKDNGLLVVAALVAPRDLRSARATMRGLLRQYVASATEPGARRRARPVDSARPGSPSSGSIPSPSTRIRSFSS